MLNFVWSLFLTHRGALFRYILVGIVAALVNLFCFVVLNEQLRIDYMISTSLAYIIATVLHFLLSRHFTFKNINALSYQIPRYLSTALVNFLITMMVVWSVVNLLLLPAVVGVILAIGASLIIGFFLNRFWVFSGGQT